MTTTGLPAGTNAVSAGPVAVVVHRRTFASNFIWVALLVVIALLSLMLGKNPIALGDVLAWWFEGKDVPGSLQLEILRLPRLVVGLLAGFAFGLGGALIQGALRNPLASPDVVGVTYGASAAVIAVLAYQVTDTVPVPVAALAGGLVATGLVYALAWRGGMDPGRFLLIGIGLAAGLAAVGQMLMTKGDFLLAERAQVWTTGSLNGREYSAALPLAIGLAVALPFLCWAGPALRRAALDDQTVTALGGRPQALRAGLTLVGVLLAALATSAVGPVNFVALIAPQVARLAAGRATMPLFASGAAGAALVTAADLIGRTRWLPDEVSAGVLTAFIGAPYLLWLISRRKAFI